MTPSERPKALESSGLTFQSKHGSPILGLAPPRTFPSSRLPALASLASWSLSRTAATGTCDRRSSDPRGPSVG
eukprot:scaffold442_cov268-Pinguiococcus_pyrenoidosus.AAC.12